VKKGSSSSSTTLLQKKKSKKSHKSQKKDIEPGSLTPIPIIEKKKWSKRSSKSSVSQNDKIPQPCLEKIVSDIIKKLLNKKLDIILSLFSKVPNKQLQDTNSIDAKDAEDKFIDDSMEINFV
jgi:ribosome assembly protein YihI (activator of Der GTPase)